MNSNEKKIYQDALEFIGEVRASISRERFTVKAVRNFEAFLDFLNDSPDAMEFLEQRRIDRSYVTQNIRMILERIYGNPENDFYFTLGLAHNASAEQIHDRWKRLMVMYHPDRNRDDGGYAGMCASKINEAYSVLKDSRKRIEYDRKILQKKTSQVNPLQDLRRERVISHGIA